ncbi:hypothetical protein L218DRAFT_548512 [Marasmius fiardii PR-910]|nr:hypothetical protein L218DRAFT_548512 [Marasmius fiardii PR-910]
MQVTSKTFCNTHFCQHVLPQMAFRFPGLMHAMLALSALHLHRLGGDINYFNLAVYHRNYVLPLLGQITEPDFSNMALAFLRLFDYADPSPSAPDIFSIVGSIHESFYGRRYEDPSINPVVSRKTDPDHNPLPFPTALYQIHLPDACPTSSTDTDTSILCSNSDFAWPNPEEVQDPVASSTYADTVQTLEESWYLLQRPGCEDTAAFMWPYRFSERFYTYLMVERRPRALVLLYYFCFLLSWLARPQQSKCWWISGQMKFGEAMQDLAYTLDEGWRRCITTIEL